METKTVETWSKELELESESESATQYPARVRVQGEESSGQIILVPLQEEDKEKCAHSVYPPY